MNPAYLRHRAEIIGILDERKYPYWFVESQISEGKIALLSNDTAIIGVERRVYPGGYEELHGMFAAGAMDGILELIDEAVAAAEMTGLDGASIASVPAWGRVLKSRGFVPHQLTITKELAIGGCHRVIIEQDDQC
jgi:hypothetical protein